MVCICKVRGSASNYKVKVGSVSGKARESTSEVSVGSVCKVRMGFD